MNKTTNTEDQLPRTLRGKGDPRAYVRSQDGEMQRLIVLDIESEIRAAAGCKKFYEPRRLSDPATERTLHLLGLRRMVLNEMALRATDEDVSKFEKLNTRLIRLTDNLTKRMDKLQKDVNDSIPLDEWKDGHCRVEGFMGYEYDYYDTLPKLPTDGSYGSDFPFIHELIYDLQQADACIGKFVKVPVPTADTAPTEADEYLNSDTYKHIGACPALRTLCARTPYSIVDVVRMKGIKSTARVTYEHNFYDVNNERIKYYGFK